MIDQFELPGFELKHHSYTCQRCGRALKDPTSIERGFGPICAALIASALGENTVTEVDDRYLDEPLENGITLVRTEGGTLFTNVPHLVQHHSPKGYEWGYAGSGPADLALNIVEGILRATGFEGALSDPLWDKYRVFRQSMKLHQGFKSEFIAGVSRQPGRNVIDYERAKGWVLGHVEDDPVYEDEL